MHTAGSQRCTVECLQAKNIILTYVLCFPVCKCEAVCKDNLIYIIKLMYSKAMHHNLSCHGKNGKIPLDNGINYQPPSTGELEGCLLSTACRDCFSSSSGIKPEICLKPFDSPPPQPVQPGCSGDESSEPKKNSVVPTLNASSWNYDRLKGRTTLWTIRRSEPWTKNRPAADFWRFGEWELGGYSTHWNQQKVIMDDHGFFWSFWISWRFEFNNLILRQY